MLEVARCLGSAAAVGLLAGLGGLAAAAHFRSLLGTLREDLGIARDTVRRLEADAPSRLRTRLAAAESNIRTLQPTAGRVPALEADLATARRTAAELTARESDPARKEALVRLLEERAAAREDALTDGSGEAVRAARLAAIDDDLGPKIEAAYAAL